jgi:predicted nucleic acid-binding Zn ribbon protein
MRRRGPRPVGFALDAVTEAIAPATLLAEVQRVWPQVAGEQVARAATPVGERDGVVKIACEASVWADHLALMSEGIVAGLNAALGRPAVRRIRTDATGWRD